jgi:hypothetical protein
MNHLQFLKERLESVSAKVENSAEYLKYIALQKTVARTDEYKEMKVLQRMIAELSTEEVLSKPALFEFGENSNLKQKQVRNYSASRNRDTEHTAVPHIEHGKRVSTIYDTAECIVKEHGGEMSVVELHERLAQEYEMKWDKSTRVTAYISCHNWTHPDDIRLVGRPEKLPHQKKSGGYKYIKYIKYIGKERLSNAV